MNNILQYKAHKKAVMILKCPIIVRNRNQQLWGVFMTKYSTDFKIMAVQKYFVEDISLKSLAGELKLPSSSVLKRWINTARQQGLEALAVKRHKSEYSLAFKAKVVEYYQTHDLGINKVAAVFNISASQVYSWDRAFKNGGLAALLPVEKVVQAQ